MVTCVQSEMATNVLIIKLNQFDYYGLYGSLAMSW